MKHTVESLKRNPTLAEIWEFEKQEKNIQNELQEIMDIASIDDRIRLVKILINSTLLSPFEALLYVKGKFDRGKQVLGDSNKKETS